MEPEREVLMRAKEEKKVQNPGALGGKAGPEGMGQCLGARRNVWGKQESERDLG